LGTLFPRVHVVTDTRPGADPLAVVDAAVSAAVALDATHHLAVQVRVQDDSTDREAFQLTLEVLARTRPAGVLCLVNDRLHVAIAADADGGHVGAHDLPVPAARSVLGPSAVLGATARAPQTALSAVCAGATYLGVGPFRDTTTKAGLPEAIGIDGVRAVAAAVDVPVIAIGGVVVGDVAGLIAAGAHGIAVVGAVSTAADPRRAAAALLAAAGGGERP
jgi:thiamine-phosphate pyrophosphorylase